mgnify:CR=1 FL=1
MAGKQKFESSNKLINFTVRRLEKVLNTATFHSLDR